MASSGQPGGQSRRQVSGRAKVSQFYQQQVQRRKWSDWSECSSDCKQTRHRINCDDLIQAQNSLTSSPLVTTTTATTTASSSSQTGNARRTTKRHEGEDEETSAANLAHKINRSPEQVDEASGTDQALDDEDYADEGDAEDTENDSCANVIDSSKTFEERRCFSSGQCLRLISENEFARYKPSTSKQSINHQARAHNQLDSTNNARDHKRPNQTNLVGTKLRAPSNQTSYLNETSPLLSSSTKPNDNNYTSTPTVVVIASKTRSIWPIQEPGELNQQPAIISTSSLIQLILLVGSLVSLILFIMLILRKVIISKSPSYQWMLAKQTRPKRKAARSIEQLACCAHHGGRHLIIENDCLRDTITCQSLDSTTAATVTGASSRWPPPHICCSQRGRQASDLMASAVVAASKKHQQLEFNDQKQLFVDLNGRHFLGSSPRTPNPGRKSQRDSMMTMSQDDNYDILIGNSDDHYDDHHRQTHMMANNKSSLGLMQANDNDEQAAKLRLESRLNLTREFVTSTQTSNSTTSSNSCKSPNMDYNLINDNNFEQRDKLTRHIDGQQFERKRRKTSPNVPNVNNAKSHHHHHRDISRPELINEDLVAQSSRSSTISDSNSIQSTTAQMMSTEPSSSLEQAPEIIDYIEQRHQQPSISSSVALNVQATSSLPQFNHQFHSPQLANKQSHKPRGPSDHIISQEELTRGNHRPSHHSPRSSLVTHLGVQSSPNSPLISANQIVAMPSSTRRDKFKVSRNLTKKVNNIDEQRQQQSGEPNRVGQNCDTIEDDRHLYEEISQPN